MPSRSDIMYAAFNRSNTDYSTASFLPSGKVLVAGGRSRGTYKSTNICSVYDPALNIIEYAAPMTVLRHAHSAIALPNGNILVVGGISFDTNTAAAEIYNEESNTWTIVAPALSRRYYGELAIKKGKVIYTGGSDIHGVRVLSGDEKYSIATNVWSLVINRAYTYKVVCRGCGSKFPWTIGTSKRNYLCLPCRESINA